MKGEIYCKILFKYICMYKECAKKFMIYILCTLTLSCCINFKYEIVSCLELTYFCLNKQNVFICLMNNKKKYQIKEKKEIYKKNSQANILLSEIVLQFCML